MDYRAIMIKKHSLFVAVCILLSLPLLHAEDLFFDSAGVKIHYAVEGKGEPVLVIHGFSGNIQGMDGIIKGLSGNFHVIAIDNRGHGKSDKPHNPAAYGMQMVEDSIRLLDHLKIQKAHVVGYSMGGRIAGAIVGSHPDRLRTAVLGGFGWESPDDPALLAYQKEMAESLEKGNGVGPLLRRLNPVGAPPPTEEQISMANKMFLASGNDPLALAAVVRNSVQSPAEPLLRVNKVPVLALIGELDPLKAGVDRLKTFMPNLKVVVIRGANHLTAPGSPDFIANLKSFLMEHSGNRSSIKSAGER